MKRNWSGYDDEDPDDWFMYFALAFCAMVVVGCLCLLVAKFGLGDTLFLLGGLGLFFAAWALLAVGIRALVSRLPD